MKMICSSHQKRGEQVLEFNLSPHYFKDLTKDIVRCGKQEIPIVSKNWKQIEGYYYCELITSEGIKMVTNLTYTIR